MSSRKKLIIDTDISLGTPGAEIDDGAALLMLLNSPEIEVLGITTVHGNVPVELATVNAMRLVALIGFPGMPVHRGNRTPLVQDESWGDYLKGWQSQYGPTPPWHGLPSPVSAPEAIIRAVDKYPGEVSILALGPLTNLAQVVQRAPHVPKLVRCVVAMGGSLSPSAQAEFNVRCDPLGASVVFGAGWPLWLHGLEITRQCLFSPQDFEALADTNPGAALLAEQAADWISVVEDQGWETRGCALHDAIAGAALLRSDFFTYQTGVNLQVMVDFGPDRGLVRVLQGEDNKNLHIAVGIDAPACKAFIQSRL
jgi:purine nucleosidase